MRVVRGFLKALGILALLLLVLVGAGFWFLQTRTAKDWLAAELTSALSQPGNGIAVGRISGHLPREIKIAEITLSDPQGPWAVLRDVSAVLDLRDLTARKLTIRRLAAADVRVSRQPAYPPSPEPRSPSGPISISVPRLPVAVDLQSFEIVLLQLAAPVLGDEVIITADGDATLGRDGTASAHLAVRRVDEQPGSATLAVSLAGDPATLSLKLDAAEPSGLLLDVLLDRTDRLPLTMSLSGSGPLADWHGKLAAKAGDRAGVDAELMLAQHGSDYRFGATGRAAPGPLLPDTIAPLAGDAVGFDIAASLTHDGRMLVADRLSVNTAAATLRGTGRVDLAANEIDATVDLRAKDLSLLSPLLDRPLSGTGTATLTARGAADHPRAEMTLDFAEPRFDGNGAARITAQLAATPSAPLTDPNAAVALAGSGRVEGIVSPAAPIPGGLGDSIDWRLDATVLPNALRADISTLDLSGAGLSLTANGQVDARELSGDGTLHLSVADLGRFSSLAGRPLSGGGKLDLVARQAADGSTTARLDGHFADLALGVPAVDGLLAGRLDLSGDATRTADGAVDLSRFEVSSGANVRAAATAALPPGAGRIKATYRIELPTLAPLASVTGQASLAGRATLDGTAEGPLDAVKADATLDAADFAAGNARLDRLTARLTATASAEPAGKLDAEFRAADLAGTLSGEFALRGTDPADRRLDIPKLRLVAGGTTVEAASLQTALDTLLTSGTVTARIPDLAPWSRLAGTALAGRADLTAALGTKGGQSVDLTLNGSGLSAAPSPESRVAIDRVALTAKLADLLDRPSGTANLAVDRVALGGPDKIDAIRLDLNAPRPGRLAFTGDVRGRVQQPINLTLGGEASIGGSDALELKLAKLAGQIAGERVQLRQPLTLARRGGDASFANLSLALGDGQVTGGGSLKGNAVALKLLAKRLPLALAGRFAGQQDVSGTLGADIDLSGTLDQPEGRIVAEAQDMRLATLSRPDLPPVGMSADAVWRGGRVDFKGRVDAPKMEGVGFSGTAPLVLRRQPSLAVDVPRDGAISLKVEGGADLANLADLLPIGEDRIAGRLTLDARVGGTIAAPAAAGRVTLTGGRYENMASGLVMNDLSAELAGDQDRFVVRRFSAKDGPGTGAMQVSGGVALSATPGPALDLKASFRQFQVVRRDEATGSASGDVQVGGTVAAPRVDAQIRVEQADVNIPDRLPPSVRRLDVVEINSRTGQAETPAKAAGQTGGGDAQAGGAAAVALDVAVDIPGRVFVRGRGLESEWRGNLSINGSAAEPIIVGRLEVVRGSFSFLGKNFQLTQGTISFDGGHKIDPALAITTEATANDVTAQVQITGTASQPTIRLTSTPELPQDEILARVLFGRNLTQITPAQGLQLAQTAAALAGGGPGVLDKVRNRLGLDRLDIGSAGSSGGLVNQLTNPNQTATGSTSATGSTGGVGNTTISAGKYVADGVYVGVDQSVSGQSRAKVEVEITPNISVETDVGAQGSQGIGLNWKMDY
jgi:translocation and assembly module TamB